ELAQRKNGCTSKDCHEATRGIADLNATLGACLSRDDVISDKIEDANMFLEALTRKLAKVEHEDFRPFASAMCIRYDAAYQVNEPRLKQVRNDFVLILRTLFVFEVNAKIRPAFLIEAEVPDDVETLQRMSS